jgi:LacI family transcriptional regulator
MTPAHRVTIVDVARHANVSTTAVSKVLRNAYGASPAMQARVRQAIEELGYRPNAAARSLRGRTYTIGALLPDLRNPFFPDILDGVNEHLRGSEYHVLLGTSCDDEPGERTVIDAMIDRGMDGIVLIAPVTPSALLEEIAATVPTVVVGRHSHSARYDTVTDDDLAGAALVVNHLADLCHRRIAHIEHTETDPTRIAEMPNAVRAEGYRRAMRDRGPKPDIVSTSYTQEGGYTGTRRLLDRDPADRPTAIFAGADIVAIGALEALSEAGLTVPGDVSLAGYDNTSIAALGPISLTSVDQAGHRIGTNAARLLLERLTDRDRPATQVKLAPTLVPRRSTGPIRDDHGSSR